MQTIEAPPPGGMSLAGLAADSLGEMVDAIAMTDRIAATAMAWRAEQIDQARRWSEMNVRVVTAPGMTPWDQQSTARRTLVMELACALRLPERTAENLIMESKALVNELPATLEALRAGDISYRHARVVLDHSDALSPESRTVFEETVIPFARTHTVAQFDRKARTTRERMDPESIAERHAKGVAQRRVELQPARDGMAWLTHFLPADEAIAIYNRATDIAVALQGKDEPRTLTQLRSDVLTDLMLDGEVAGRSEFGIRPWVAVTVPVLTLLGHDDEPASLEGYGPIDIETARKLTAKAPSLVRILTHPETGAVLSVGRQHYRVPADLRTWLRIRDEHCRAPGCSRAAARCDIDHTSDWVDGGQTSHDNLAHLCRYHHGVKHHTEWNLTHLGGGDLEWAAPSGRRYATEPANRIAPAADAVTAA